jgi:2-isopropylmalate synthase
MTETNGNGRVTIFDTTLRDGEQAPGASMNLAEKLKVAAALQALRVDVLEAGFPASSPGDFESVQAIARKISGASVCALARATREDVERAWDALRDAEKPRIHVFLATSPIHRELKLKMAKPEIVRRAVQALGIARSLCEDVEFSPEDASRTEPDFLAEVVERAIEAGATTINIPDTVGYAMPAQFGAIIAMLRKKVRGIERAVISVHCHNDLGLAVANSLAAVQEGARQVECTVNGIGERAGNCSLEEVVMAIRTRADYLGVHTNVRTTQLYAASRVVSQVTGFTVQRNKAVVGENAFAHEAGIHQHGMLQHPSTYEIMRPEDVGFRSSSLVLGKHSGRHTLRLRLQQLGYELEDGVLDRVFGDFKELADRKKEIFDGDLEALVEGIFHPGQTGRWKLVSIQAVSGTNASPSASVCLELRNGQRREDAATGDGPVDAVFKSIERIAGLKVKLCAFQVRNMTPGEDAQGEVRIEVDHDGRSYHGRGVSTDIVVASAHAFLEVVNRISAARPLTATDSGVEVRCGAV